MSRVEDAIATREAAKGPRVSWLHTVKAGPPVIRKIVEPEPEPPKKGKKAPEPVIEPEPIEEPVEDEPDTTDEAPE
jgi:hypothetical protein